MNIPKTAIVFAAVVLIATRLVWWPAWILGKVWYLARDGFDRGNEP